MITVARTKRNQPARFQKRNKTSGCSRRQSANFNLHIFVCNQLGTHAKIPTSVYLMDKKIFTKTYRLIKSDNYDAFLREAGASPLRRRQEQRERPTVQLRQVGKNYVLKTASEHDSKLVKFRPNERFVQKGYDDKTVQTIMSFENGNTLVEMQLGRKPVTILREFFHNGIVEMMMCDKTVCCRVFSSSQ